MDSAPPSPAPAAGPESALQTAWPRSVQGATAGLLVLAVVLLACRSASYLGWRSQPTELTSGAGLTYRVDLNRAPRAELLLLPGVGAGLAQRIENYRQENSGFRSVEELRQVHGVGPALLERMRPWVCVTLDEEEEESEAAGRVLHDERLAGPVKVADLSSKKAAQLTGRINVNRASAEELQRLPGIGKVLSERIVSERRKGLFKSTDDLRRVFGIGPKTLERLRPYVTTADALTAVAASGES